MQLSKEAIEEFKQIYKEEFGEEISNQEAYEQGIRLITLFKIFCQIEYKYRLRQEYYQRLLSVFLKIIQDKG